MSSPENEMSQPLHLSNSSDGFWGIRSVGWAFCVICIAVWTVCVTWRTESGEISRRGGPQTFVVDLNLATEAELNLLPGVGPKLAKDILRVREERGRFEAIEELKLVPGIKGIRFETLKKHVCVGR